MPNAHECGPYYTGDEHCELVWTDENGSDGRIRQPLGYLRGLRVSCVEPAAEAPDIEMLPATQLDPVAVGSRPAGALKWLVWWS